MAITLNATTGRLYINGVSPETATLTEPIGSFTSGTVQLGCNDSGLDQCVGDLDEVRLYGRELTAQRSQIWRHLECGHWD